MYYLLYILYFIPHLLVVILCWWTNPIACMFPSRQTNGRDKLWGIFNLWSTHDACVDEGYYSEYFGANTPQGHYDYDHSAWLRYKYRLLWLKRNTGYGWTYLLFSLPKGKGFQIKKLIPINFWFFGFKYNDLNIGWKAHGGIERLSYAQGVLRLKRIKPN